MAPEERAELSGTVLEGRYRVGECIGIGGTGVVFEATRLCDGETVVVKTLRPVFAFDSDLCRRLRREGEVSRVVRHPGIVPIMDDGTLIDGSPFIVMPFVTGESLSHMMLRANMLSVPEVATIAIRVAAILHAVHQHGYVHRDVKPEHVYLDRAPGGELQVWLLDFGVCAAATAPLAERNRERGRVFGTPSYVSPEQACGDPNVDGRADVFGLGATMFECLSGRVPFSASTVNALLRRIIREDAPRVGLIASHVGRELDQVVARCLARDLSQRFPTARALARALVKFAGKRAETERHLAANLWIGEVAVDAGEIHADTAREEVAAA